MVTPRGAFTDVLTFFPDLLYEGSSVVSSHGSRFTSRQGALRTLDFAFGFAGGGGGALGASMFSAVTVGLHGGAAPLLLEEEASCFAIGTGCLTSGGPVSSSL